MSVTENVVFCARALLSGKLPEGALGQDVLYAVRGFRAGMVDRQTLLESVARAYREAGPNAVRFDRFGNLRRT